MSLSFERLKGRTQTRLLTDDGDPRNPGQAGRLPVISSLQVYDPDNDGVGTQWIMWQRCKGIKNYSSAYGNEDDGRNGSLPGMGPATERVTALPGEAVIYVEVVYEYKPLVSRQMVPGGTLIRSQSAYTVRDRRDITAIYQRNPGNPDPIARCNQRDAFTDPPPT